MSKKIGFISLGCPKNQVDSEIMLNKLASAGYEITDTPIGADAVIINTCGFIEAAKRESIDNILEMAGYKEDGDLGKIIVTGCMAERYKDEILTEMPEVDAVAGIGANGDIVEFVNGVFAGGEKTLFPSKDKLPLCGERMLTTPSYWAYLKIADGCSNCCTYCAIPKIRGPQRSRTIESIVEEAERLVSGGAKELIVIAQDTTRYGDDIYGEPKLAELIKKLDEIDGVEWIRLLYCYPDRLTDEVLEAMSGSKHILHYIDLPLQHADGRILKAMNRHGDSASLLQLIEKIRGYMPDCVIRTTFITGFPGEDEQAFEVLSQFVNDARFDRLGCFAYSPEEGTVAEKLPDRPDTEVAEHRGEVIMDQQFKIFSEKQEELIGQMVRCVVEDYDGFADVYVGRTWRDAPEIDSGIFIVAPDGLDIGDFVNVKITGTKEYDLTGVVAE